MLLAAPMPANMLACRESLGDALFRSPSVFGRLMAIAALRGRHSGIYTHPLSEEFGAVAVNQALRRMHREIFVIWLNFTFWQQERDLKIWLTSLDRSPEMSTKFLDGIVERLTTLLPAHYCEAERELFCCDFRIVRELVCRTDSAGANCQIDYEIEHQTC